MRNDFSPKQAEASAGCNHREMEYVGSNQGARFLRCEACSKLYVVQDGRIWSLPLLARSSAA